MDDLYKGIADPVRRQILDLLAKQPLNINQINEYFDHISRQAVSKHINILEACGLIKIYTAGRERYGYLDKQAFYEMDNWLKKYLMIEKNALRNDYGVILGKTEQLKGQPLTYPVMLQAMLSKDGRYDGEFYIAVKTTGIFCKPSCSARPKPENVIFCKTREEAVKNGFRPCKKCRP